LTSLDAYRGFVMFLMAAEALQLPRVARSFPDNPVWQFIAHHTSHVEWVGVRCRYDPAVLHVSGGSIAAVLGRQSQRKRPAVWDHASTCDGAVADFDFPRHLPAIGWREANKTSPSRIR